MRRLFALFLIATGCHARSFDDDALFVEPGIDPGDAASDRGPPPAPTPIVYAHSASTLYRLDPTTNGVMTIGPFQGCSDVIDLAIDGKGRAFATGASGLYRVDLGSAACTKVALGSYPNSLSFVPKGTLDPSNEALVGYMGNIYVRIDEISGAVTQIGTLSAQYSSSGDLVSIEGGGTFLTVVGPDCGDCLVQVDPRTGAMIQSYGPVQHAAVYGLAFWAGTAYGFTSSGQLFRLSWNGVALETHDLILSSGVSFWGAGSTTMAPALDPNGGTIPIH